MGSHFAAKAKNLWETWDIRVFILCSLIIQALLTFLAPLRKSSSSSCLRFLIWLLYLTADAVGIFVIGLISSNEGDFVHKQELLAFWAPFLLLHLGGPDTITALALEDNELWNRHALQLATQLVITIYVFILTFRKQVNHHLIFPTLLILVDGLIKYIERTCALFFASEDSFRDSLVGTPEPGPNYARLMEEYFSAKGAHIPTDFEGKDGLLAGETRSEETEARNNEEQPTDTNTNDGQRKELDSDEEIVREAHEHYQMFKALLADGFLSLKDRKASRTFFLEKGVENAVKIIEIELNLIYDIFYTKFYLLQKKRACFRVLCFLSAIASLIYFCLKMANIEDKMKENRLRWFGHVQRREEVAPVRRVESWTTGDLRRGRGRPKISWMTGVKKDMREFGLTPYMALDRNEWRRRIHVHDSWE